jgi:cation:H+ antiporter
MNLQTILMLLVGLVLLVVGAEGLVRGASRLAGMLGISPLIIGLTIVAYGTSSPEMFVSFQSSVAGNADIALGNVVGSNIFNVLFILGVSALVSPLIVAQQLIRLDVPIMVGVSVLTLLLSLDGKLNFSEGVFLFMGGVGYTLFLIWQSRKEGSPEVQEEYAQEYSFASDKPGLSWAINLGFIAGGLALLALGSNWLITSSTTIARSLGVSDLVIGLTIVAAGTSLPELATSVIASMKGERDIAVGNVVGSNIFNILAVLGVAAMASPDGAVNVVSGALWFDIPVMIAVAVACLPIFFTGNVIDRWEGVVFIAYYFIYTLYLILKTTQHDSLPMFSAVLGWFAIPLTLLTLAVISWRELRLKKRTG